jgi:predicted amidohydrolase
MSEGLPIALLHLAVKYGELDENRAALAYYAQEAAHRGARIIVAPELAVSGYSFDSRSEVAPSVEVLAGETYQRLAPVARRHGVMICTGFAERDPATDIFYNSALVVGPDGAIAAHHRKVASERRWARPGEPSHNGLFDTPWGRMGVLICADTYYGVLARSLAVQGVDLVFAPANWPLGGIDPRPLWRARALENGIGVIGCNRTGMDRRMDCTGCPSYAVAPDGRVLLDATSEVPCIWMVDYPLENGKLPSAHREALMATRRPREFTTISLDMNGLDDFSALWGLPETGPLDVRCLIPASPEEAAGMLESAAHETYGTPTLLIFPRGVGPASKEWISELAAQRNLAVVAEVDGNGTCSFLATSRNVTLRPNESCVMADFGPARLALAHPDTLRHPEYAVALSKQGCDLLVTTAAELDPDSRLLLAVKCLERAAVALVDRQGAMVCEPPEGHSPWKETVACGPGVCSVRLETATLRTKRFLDRVNMEALLRS